MSLTFKIDDDIKARSLQLKDVEKVHDLITANRLHLDQWLRWSSSIQTLKDVKKIISTFITKEVENDGFHCGIWVENKLAGGVVCWYINKDNRNCEVGYWLGKEFTGRGLATKSTRAIINFLFSEQNLHRIEMQCGVENTASRKVAERCGLRKEGIRRDSHWITDSFVDHVIYGILSEEWNQ